VKKRIKPDAIVEIQASGQARWKFVVCGPADLVEIAGLQQESGLTKLASDRAAASQWVCQAAGSDPR
jgi:hypothetical protein